MVLEPKALQGVRGKASARSNHLQCRLRFLLQSTSARSLRDHSCSFQRVSPLCSISASLLTNELTGNCFVGCMSGILGNLDPFLVFGIWVFAILHPSGIVLFLFSVVVEYLDFEWLLILLMFEIVWLLFSLSVGL